MTVELGVEARCQEIASGHEVGGPLDCPGADDGDVVRSRRCNAQGDGAGTSRADAHRVVGGQRELGVVLVNRQVGLRRGQGNLNAYGPVPALPDRTVRRSTAVIG